MTKFRDTYLKPIPSPENEDDCPELTAELATGKQAARALVYHLRTMGAESCQIPIEHDGEKFEVSIRRTHEQAEV